MLLYALSYILQLLMNWPVLRGSLERRDGVGEVLGPPRRELGVRFKVLEQAGVCARVEDELQGLALRQGGAGVPDAEHEHVAVARGAPVACLVEHGRVEHEHLRSGEIDITPSLHLRSVCGGGCGGSGWAAEAAAEGRQAVAHLSVFPDMALGAHLNPADALRDVYACRRQPAMRLDGAAQAKEEPYVAAADQACMLAWAACCATGQRPAASGSKKALQGGRAPEKMGSLPLAVEAHVTEVCSEHEVRHVAVGLDGAAWCHAREERLNHGHP